MGLKENIKQKRMEKEMTLEELANKVGVSRQTIQRYESGIISNIPSDKIELMADALKTTPAYLMGWEQPVNASASITLYNVQCETKDEAELILAYREISDISKKKVSSYAYNIRDIEKADFEVNAAHSRTDIDIPEDVDTSEDDIMDDEDF